MNNQIHSKMATHKTVINQNLLRHARLKYANAQCNTHIELLVEGPKKEFSLFISIIVFEPQNKLVSLKQTLKQTVHFPDFHSFTHFTVTVILQST